MTDKEKYEALVAEIEHQKKETSIGLNEWENGEEHGRMDVINALQEKIKSMQGEPVSEDLEAAIDTYLATYFGGEKEKQEWPFLKKMAIHFAEWQKQQMMAKAIDGEVGYWNLHGLSCNVKLPHNVEEGDKVKLIIIKED